MEGHSRTLLRVWQNRVESTRGGLDALTGIGASIGCQSKPPANAIGPEQRRLHLALAQLSPVLADSYFQAKLDLADESRISAAGTAHEIRQVLSTMLELMAPDQTVIEQPWYRKDPQSQGGPTQKQRVHYILLQRGANSKEREAVEQVTEMLAMIENLVRATYGRASDAAHRFKARKEVQRIMEYFEVFARDLLNI